MALVTLSTVSANKEKKCLVKSGKDTKLTAKKRRYTASVRSVYLLLVVQYIFSPKSAISK